ncbi:hypothetical protein ACLOJK_018797 [Asimina triloba]
MVDRRQSQPMITTQTTPPTHTPTPRRQAPHIVFCMLMGNPEYPLSLLSFALKTTHRSQILLFPMMNLNMFCIITTCFDELRLASQQPRWQDSAVGVTSSNGLDGQGSRHFNVDTLGFFSLLGLRPINVASAEKMAVSGWEKQDEERRQQGWFQVTKLGIFCDEWGGRSVVGVGAPESISIPSAEEG